MVRKRGEIMRRDQPQLPQTLDAEFIRHELEEFRRSPNIIAAYIDSLFLRFRTKQERMVLEKLIKYNETVARGIASQAEIMRQKRELEEAVTAYNISKDAGIRELKHADAKLAIKESLAQREANIREANLRGRKPERDQAKEDKTRRTPEEVRAEKEHKFDYRAQDIIAEQLAKDGKIRDLDQLEQEELKGIREDSGLTAKEREEAIYRAQTKYANLRAKIDDMKF